jgi:hypothetical protein
MKKMTQITVRLEVKDARALDRWMRTHNTEATPGARWSKSSVIADVLRRWLKQEEVEAGELNG